jgi:hypothetical protein
MSSILAGSGALGFGFGGGASNMSSILAGSGALGFGFGGGASNMSSILAGSGALGFGFGGGASNMSRMLVGSEAFGFGFGGGASNMSNMLPELVFSTGAEDIDKLNPFVGRDSVNTTSSAEPFKLCNFFIALEISSSSTSSELELETMLFLITEDRFCSSLKAVTSVSQDR